MIVQDLVDKPLKTQNDRTQIIIIGKKTTITMNAKIPPSTLWHALLSTLRSQSGVAESYSALVSPQQKIKWTFEELHRKARGLSVGLQDRGVMKHSVVATDLPNVAEGLVLHLACARLGAAVATAKNADMLKTMLPQVQCAVVTPSSSSWLSQETFHAPHIVAGDSEMVSMLNYATTTENSTDLDDDTDEFAPKRPLGYFGSGKALTHGEAVQQGRDMVVYFDMFSEDKVCVSITLYHAFGIGSACSAALQAGAAIVLPAVGGLQGCGVPSQRATVTLQTLADQQCTLLFADTHTLNALHDESLSKNVKDANVSAYLRGGVCKTGSGTEILPETVDWAGVTLATLGKKS
jgi:AMP-binding enzyme